MSKAKVLHEYEAKFFTYHFHVVPGDIVEVDELDSELVYDSKGAMGYVPASSLEYLPDEEIEST